MLIARPPEAGVRSRELYLVVHLACGAIMDFCDARSTPLPQNHYYALIYNNVLIAVEHRTQWNLLLLDD